MRKNTLHPQIEVLLDAIDLAFDHRAWHGPNLRGSIRGVTSREAAWRPGSGRHNIWELVVHAAYWKYAARRRLRGDRRGAFPLPGSNWFARPAAADERQWRADVALLEQEHHQLRVAVQSFSHSRLHQRPAPTSRSEEHTSELQSPCNLVCRLLLEKKKEHSERATYFLVR